VRWGEDWSTVAWGLYQAGQRVDAEEALRRLRASGELPARARFLEAEMHLARGDEDAALASYDAAFAAGGEDYRARMARAELLVRKGQPDRALVELAAAERVFPGYPEPELAAEMKLADVYDRRGETDLANEARMRWLGYNAGDFDHRVGVAAWLDEKGRHAESVRWWNEANEVDPFRRFLHHRWALALRALGRHEEALRELEVGIRMPAELDVEASPAESPFLPETDPATVAARWRELEPVLLGLKALSLFDLERPAEARAAAEAALAIDPDEESARKVLQLAQ
jgi:tetratricopeptide (TPR) repeat protein